MSHQASHRRWGSLTCSWPRASSVGSDQPRFHVGKGLGKLAGSQCCSGKEQQCLAAAAPCPGSEGCCCCMAQGTGGGTPSLKKSCTSFSCFYLERKRKKLHFFGQVKGWPPLLGVPRLGSPSPSPTRSCRAAPALPSSSWMASQQGAAGEILASAGERQPAAGKGGEGEPCISNAPAHHPRKHPRNCSHMLAPTALASEPQIPFSAPGAAVQPSPSQTCLSSPALGQERAAPVLHHGPVNSAGAAGSFQHTLKPRRKTMDPGLDRALLSLSFLPVSSTMNIYPLVWAVFRRPSAFLQEFLLLRRRAQPGAGARGSSPFHGQSPHPRGQQTLFLSQRRALWQHGGKASGRRRGGDGVRAAGREGGHGEPPEKRENGM